MPWKDPGPLLPHEQKWKPNRLKAREFWYYYPIGEYR